MKNQDFSVKSIAFFLAFLTIFVSCSQYDNEIRNEGLNVEQKTALKNSTLEYVENLKNGNIDFTKDEQSNLSVDGNPDINAALGIFVSHDLSKYELDVMNYKQWTNEEQASIEAIFIVMKTFKDNFTEDDAAKIGLVTAKTCGETEIPWFAPLAFWGVCTVVGVLTVGIAGVACAGLVAARISYCNYQLQN